ncbi:amidase signature domain-containing protein [Aspergillus pseudonomiae]|uniref:amidase n=1 Tax=Aspergillus pseudonomiae TaxID=1506151 RepID=A0A5N6I5G3_9EURO|nr:amidase signature domain-containing protein [Aspergillus pseudonomiae]KAB8261414.1 amidase signature domain-containing protein [Aspergillus pseudonomiae]KAE8400079.1 amidase signature domain-containing protein [Aspergillus pseudonomiae]
MGSNEESSWQQRVERKRQACANKIPAEWCIPDAVMASLDAPLADHKNNLIQKNIIRESGIMTAHELHITEEYTVLELLAALASGSLSSVEVTTAYCKRAAIAQQLVACLTETMFAEAYERAQYLDQLRSQGQVVGPLHGLPVSIKDSFHYKGTEATIGMVSFLGEVSTGNSPLVEILLKLGAVIYVKTNVPQTMMALDSQNNVFGRTLNPWNTTLTPGGSSGGEGALVALRGSPLGVGTDVGGSIRVPALCCGTYGFRPSASRVPNAGTRACSTSGMRFILSCAGPLSLDLEGLEVFFRSVFDIQPSLYDSTVIDVPWRMVTVKPKLRIGLVPEHPVFPLHPPVKRILAKAKQRLEEHGHEIILLSHEECRIKELNEVALGIFGLDQGALSHVISAGEPVVPALQHIGAQIAKVKQFHESSLPDMSSMDRLATLAALNTRRAELKEDYRNMWTKHNLDICLAPPAQNTAVAHDSFGPAPYTIFLNCLDYPACVIPFGQVNELDATEPFQVGDDQIAPEYDYQSVEGAPCGIQLFTTTMRDEECLQMSKLIDRCLRA